MEFGKIKERDGQVKDGVWISGIPGFEEVELKVRPMHSRRVLLALDALRREAFNSLPIDEDADPKEINELPEDVLDEIGVSVSISDILVDWRNLTHEGEPIPFSTEKAAEFIQVDFFADGVNWASQEANRILKKRQEAVEGN